MKWDDLINAPYKPRGRSARDGFDCYGLVIECARRAGTPLADAFADVQSLPAGKIEEYIRAGLNVKKTNVGKVGDIALTQYNGAAHVGYIVERGQILHATVDKGARVSPLAAMRVLGFYRILPKGARECEK